MDKRLYEPIKHKFEPDEIRELGETLARENQSIIDLRDDKASSTATFSAQIKAATKRVAELALKINNGYEVRDVECMYAMDTPRTGMKTLIRCDTSLEVRIEAMTLEEQQHSFNFIDPDEPDGKSRGAGDK